MAKLAEEVKARRALERRSRSAMLAEEEDARQTRKRREWVANGTYLSLEELEAHVPCRGCGQSIIDRLGEWPPLMQLDDQQKRDYVAAEAEFNSRHPECTCPHWDRGRCR